MNQLNLAEKLLSFIEEKEFKLLSWGFYDTYLSSQEIENLVVSEGPEDLKELWQEAISEGWDMPTFLENLCSPGINFFFRNYTDQYRTRFSEAIRLLSKLRQWMPEQSWSQAKPLISDLKIHLAKRKYPIRDKKPSDVWEEITNEASWADNPILKEIFDDLSQNPDTGSPFEYANFQAKGFRRIAKSFFDNKLNGTVISSGTGSGKTKAFYLPAFLGVAKEIINGNSDYTKVISIYPRNVLLVDQMAEALDQVNIINKVLRRNQLRPISFGVLSGNCPEKGWIGNVYNGVDRVVRYSNWKRTTEGYEISFAQNPNDRTRNLVWKDEDRLADPPVSRLYDISLNGETEIVSDKVLRLTRQDLLRSPPDFLFLSIEMPLSKTENHGKSPQ